MGKKDVEVVPIASPYGVDQQTLNDINEKKDLEGLAKLGGVEGVAKILCSDCTAGLDENGSGEASIDTHKQVFGPNSFPAAPPKSFFMLAFENCQDPIIIVLMIAALVSTVLGAALAESRAKNEWIEGVAIWVAVLIVVCVGAGNDYQKDIQFRKLNAQKDIIEVKVVRSHQQMLVASTDIVVGDVLLLDTGDKIMADGILIQTQGLVVDEASLTGESDPIKKTREKDPWCRSGTQVSEGSGRILIVAVGLNSEWGKTMSLIQTAEETETPLQEQLAKVAATIGKVGVAVAVACFCSMLIKWCVDNKGFPIKQINNHGPIQFFLYGITIIVVAVPEGLPLAVTISLAYSMKKMMKDNNFVRVLSACETMGGATAICSDKTGTLTENRMTVVEGWFAGHKLDHAPAPNELQPELLEQLKLNIALNSKAFLVVQHGTDRVDFVGNRTECALLMLLRKWGHDYAPIREEYESQGKQLKLYGFSSAKKMASVLVKHNDSMNRLYNKGAAEWVLEKCTRLINEYGDIVDMTDDVRVSLSEVVVGMATRGLRCICLTYTDVPNDLPEEDIEDSSKLDNNLIALAIVGIKDPVRQEVPDAVQTCQRAGIVVRMVTGDNIHTAKHISQECGILNGPDFICMEGPDFRKLTPAELLETLPRLRVLARSSPEDKLTLVRELKATGEVVAVTGDGTNDAPALKESDVGLAMGIAGTEVSKEAADIVIMDDNFSSIVKSVLWGRSVFNNIRKFLMFQLTVNCTGLVVAFVGAVAGGIEPLNVMQLLWVNLIMDTLGALALATEDPNPELLLEKPHGRTESLISPVMWKHIFVQSAYQLFWLFVCLFALPVMFSRYEIVTYAEYYQNNCYAAIADDLNLNTTNTTVSSDLSEMCNIMSYCGFPVGRDTRNTNNCTLYPYWSTVASDGLVPNDPVVAICGYFPPHNTSVVCPEVNQMEDYKELLNDDYTDQKEDDRKDSLSVLFNVFIWCQLSNEINARRINDELTIFEGLHKSPIFLGVLLFTAVFQVIIMETKLNMFFKVHGLEWEEWLASIAIGLGSIPFSLLTRVISRCARRHVNHPRRTSKVHSILS